MGRRKSSKREKLENWFSNTYLSREAVSRLATTMAIFQPLKFFNEMVIQEIDLSSALNARKIGIPLSIIITGPLIKAREAYHKYVWKINNSGEEKLKSVLADFTFAVPISASIYSTILYNSGVEPSKIPKTIATGIGLTLGAGVPLGSYAISSVDNYLKNKKNSLEYKMKSGKYIDPVNHKIKGV